MCNNDWCDDNHHIYICISVYIYISVYTNAFIKEVGRDSDISKTDNNNIFNRKSNKTQKLYTQKIIL
jgi:hypothetical protein